MSTGFTGKIDALARKQEEIHVVTFGEVMLRIGTVDSQTFYQALPGKLDLTFGGAEANVAVSLAMLGRETRFVSALPKNVLADACIRELKGFGVDTSSIVRTDEGRMGIYFLETGANQRPSKVLYDRNDSVISLTPPEAYDWEAAFADSHWLHVTGITPALTSLAARSVLDAVKRASEKGCIVSCDLNYRNKLWKWDSSRTQKELAGNTMRGILPFVDILIANEEDAKDVLGIQSDIDVTSGTLDSEKYTQTAAEIVREFPNISVVATTLRESISASHNNWGALLYDARTGSSYLAPLKEGTYSPFPIRNIVDRVGGGDAFSAGLIFALSDKEIAANAENPMERALAFAVASSCLSHSIPGDYNYTNKEDVMKLMGGDGSGRVQR